MPLFPGLLLLLLYSATAMTQSTPPTDARETTLLTAERRQVLYDLMQQLPEGAEAGLALLDGEQTTYYGARKTNDSVVTVTNADRSFGIGSVTKVFTATLLASMVEDGTVSLDDPVPAAYDFLFADSITFTYRQLATHTSGLPRLPPNMPGSYFDPYANYTPEQLEGYLREDLTLMPKGQGGYSNLGFGLLGYTLGRYIAGSDYAKALRQHVLQPLNLHDTHFGAGNTPDIVSGLNSDGSPATVWSFTETMGACGALVSTPRDMARFLRAQLDTTNPALSLARQEQTKLNDRMSVGLGWQILQMNGGNTVYWHNGAVGGYRSFVAIDVATGRGVVLLTNVFLEDASVDRTGLLLLH